MKAELFKNNNQLTNPVPSSTSFCEKKKKKSEINYKTFVNQLLFEFNSARSNPIIYCEKIKNHMNCIKLNENQYYYENDIKIMLKNGKKCFNDTIEIMSSLPPLVILQFSDDLVIHVPEDFNYQIKNDLIKTKKNDPLFAFKNIGFNLDISGKNAEACCILQLIDDTGNKGQRRSNILNPDFRYVGISAAKGKGKTHTVYSIFSE